MRWAEEPFSCSTCACCAALCCAVQVSLQVHDINGRVARLQQLLERQGFRVVVWKEPRFVDCCLYMVYGVR